MGDADYNEELAQLRVDAVHEYLVENGFPDERIIDLVWGEARPDAATDSQRRATGRRVEVQGPRARAEDRRVEIKLRREE